MSYEKWADSLLQVLSRDPLEAAQAVLGAVLVHGNRKARIVEAEAYHGPTDPGSHAHRGPTPRNLVMFGKPGHAYVYFTYGMHWMLNVACMPEDQGSAVLLRAAEPLEGLEEMRSLRVKALRDEDLLNGPAKLAQAFEVDRRQNGIYLLDSFSELRLEPGVPVRSVLSGVRIGMAKGKGDELPWRFVDAEKLKWVSRPWPKG